MSRYEFFPPRPAGPLDSAYVQTRWVRTYRPSGPRWLLCAGLAVVQVGMLFLAVVVLARSVDPWSAALAVVVAVGSSAALCLLILRLALTGVWVTDAGIRVISLTTFVTRNWADVADVFFDRDGDRRLSLVLADGTVVRTPVRPGNLDFIGRPEALDMAAETGRGWFELARRKPRR